MPDPPPDNPPEGSNASEFLPQAHQLLEEIRAIKGQADANLKQAEVARKNADSEALLAFNAKKACEEHATAISGVKGAVEVNANAIATNKQRSDEALAAVNAAKASVDADIKAVGIRLGEIEQFSSEATQGATSATRAAETGGDRLKEIEALKESADGQARLATTSAKAAAQAATDADSEFKRTEKSSGDAAALVSTISEHGESTAQTVEKTEALLSEAQAAEIELKGVLGHLTRSDEIATAHETRVEALKSELEGLIASVERLLPGATSAGLASSFNKQRARFTVAQKQWLWTFIACIAFLVILAVPSFIAALGWPHQTDQSLSSVLRSFILRLPILAPILWLGIYAGRNYMMSLRMEEDYAYKEAISSAFEGYKREMEKIVASEGDSLTPMMILASNVLRAIAERPGRIYEGRQKDINAVTEVQGLIEQVADFSKKRIATQ